MSSQSYPQLDAQEILANFISKDQFQPVPHPAKNRKAWDDLANTHGKPYIQWADENIDYHWPNILATDIMALGREDSRVAIEKPNFDRRIALQYFVMAECLTGQGKYLDQIINGIWIICEETYWCLPTHAGAGKDFLFPDIEDPILDLFASQTGQQLAWTVWLLGDQLDVVSPEICKQAKRKVKHFVLDAIINHPRHWLGRDPKYVMNNWTPWICATYLSSAWIFEDDPRKLEHAIMSICNALNIFISQQPEDGGCDEGVRYWPMAAGALFECLDQLGGMTGQPALFMEHPLIQKLAGFPAVMHIAQNDFVNFGDSSAYGKFRPGFLFHKFGSATGNDVLLEMGQAIFARTPVIERTALENFYRQIQLPFLNQQIDQGQKENSQRQVPLDHWLSNLQLMTARSTEVSGKGWHVTAKGGHNGESHNHNDVGQFVVYRDGHPLLVDLGVETYNGKTFRKDRYDIFTMQSQWHNLPQFGDVDQLPGKEFAAKNVQYQSEKGVSKFVVDIADAYPKAAQLQSYIRTVELNRNENVVVISDCFECAEQAETSMTLHLITVSKVEIDGQKLIFTPVDLPHGRVSASAEIVFEGVVFDTITVEEKSLEDPVMQESWGKMAYRIHLKLNQAIQANYQMKITLAPGNFGTPGI